MYQPFSGQLHSPSSPRVALTGQSLAFPPPWQEIQRVANRPRKRQPAILMMMNACGLLPRLRSPPSLVLLQGQHGSFCIFPENQAKNACPLHRSPFFTSNNSTPRALTWTESVWLGRKCVMISRSHGDGCWVVPGDNAQDDEGRDVHTSCTGPTSSGRHIVLRSSWPTCVRTGNGTVSN